MTNQLYGAGGRRYVVKAQNSHAIPQALFSGAAPAQVIVDFQSFGGWESYFDFDGLENTQALPEAGNGNSNFPTVLDSAHSGSHPSINGLAELRLTALKDALAADAAFQSDFAAARGGDPDALDRVLTRYADGLREISFAIQIRSTGFMDAGNQVGRLIYNSGRRINGVPSELSALQNTATWANATPAEQAAAINNSEGRSLLIRRHNTLVMNTPLTAVQENIQRTLINLGGGKFMAHTEGSLEALSAIRALANYATTNNIDLSQPNAVMTVIRDLNQQANDLNGNTLRSQQVDALRLQWLDAPLEQRPAIELQISQLNDEIVAAQKLTPIAGIAQDEFNNGLTRTVTATPRLAPLWARVWDDVTSGKVPLALLAFTVAAVHQLITSRMAEAGEDYTTAAKSLGIEVTPEVMGQIAFGAGVDIAVTSALPIGVLRNLYDLAGSLESLPYVLQLAEQAWPDNPVARAAGQAGRWMEASPAFQALVSAQDAWSVVVGARGAYAMSRRLDQVFENPPSSLEELQDFARTFLDSLQRTAELAARGELDEALAAQIEQDMSGSGIGGTYFNLDWLEPFLGPVDYSVFRLPNGYEVRNGEVIEIATGRSPTIIFDSQDSYTLNYNADGTHTPLLIVSVRAGRIIRIDDTSGGNKVTLVITLSETASASDVVNAYYNNTRAFLNDLINRNFEPYGIVEAAAGDPEGAEGWIRRSALDHGLGIIEEDITPLHTLPLSPSVADALIEHHNEFFEFFQEMGEELGEAFSKISAGQLGSIFGSNLSRLIQTDDPFAAIGVGTLLGTVGLNIGQAIDDLDGLPTTNPLRKFGNLPEELLDAGLNAVSAYFVGEWVANWDIGEVGTGVVTSSLNATISTIAENLQHLGESLNSSYWVKWGVDGNLVPIFDPATGVAIPTSAPMPDGAALREWNTDVGGALGNAAGAFIGSWLASELVHFDTISGQIGASIGSAVGAMVATAIVGESGAVWGMQLGGLAGPVGAAIGAFVGYIVGGLIGSIIKTGNPRSGATLAWNESQQEFITASSWSKNKGSREAAVAFSDTIAGVLNAVIAQSGSKLLSMSAVRTGEYGTYKTEYVYYDKAGYIAFRKDKVDDLITAGAFMSLSDLLKQMMGGDVYVKRAIANTLAQSGGNAAILGQFGAFDMNVLTGNLSTAADYAGYLQNSALINALIAAQPESTFAVGWIITFARAMELGLDKRGLTDWVGGWSAFLDESKSPAVAGVGGAITQEIVAALSKRSTIDGDAFFPTNLSFEVDLDTNERLFVFTDVDGAILGTLGDTIDTASKTIVTGTIYADRIIVGANNVIDDENDTGVVVGTDPADGYLIRVAARINAGAGDDWVEGGDLGNDLFGGAGDDTLIGGVLDDWIFGEAGNDTLYASAGGLAAPGNGDLLDGGDGDDIIFGSLGSDWLKGGGGADYMEAGAGGDILDSGEGADVHVRGGAGSDQYIFNFGYGADIIYDDADPAHTPGATTDSITDNINWINQDAANRRNWAGDGTYTADGTVRGGDDAIVFGAGVTMRDIFIKTVGMDLVIGLMALSETTHEIEETGDTLTIKDWHNGTTRVEWLRFADGDETRLADFGSFQSSTPTNRDLVGTRRSDFLFGDAQDNNLFGLDGDDYGIGGRGNDFVAGNANDDIILGGADNDQVVGGTGADIAFGDGGNDYVYGGAGNDEVVGGTGNDLVVGGAGNDVFRYWRGDRADTLIDELVDRWDLVYQRNASNEHVYSSNYTVDPGTSHVSQGNTLYFDGLHWINGIYDYVYETDTLYRHLGAGADGRVSQNVGADRLEFGVGIDLQHLEMRRGPGGDDLEIAILTNEASASAFADIGDRITIKDWFSAGAARSIESFVFVATATHNMTAIDIAQNATDGANTIVGSANADWITAMGGDDLVEAGGGDDIVTGGEGNDTLRGGMGVDVLYGGGGTDTLEGGAGADKLFGGENIDFASYANATGAVTTYLDTSAVAVSARSRDANGDTYNAIEGLEGSSGSDRLGGDSGQNILRGGAGNDRMLGGTGADIYEIGLSDGNDVILEGAHAVEEIIKANANPAAAQLNTDLFELIWTPLGQLATAAGLRYCYQLTIRRKDDLTVVYESRPQIDFIFTAAQAVAPAPAAWPFSNGQWRAGAGRTGNGVQTVWERRVSGDDSTEDGIEFGEGITLADLTFTRSNDNKDLTIAYGDGNSVKIEGQTETNRGIESLNFNDNLTANLKNLKIRSSGENGENNKDDLVVGSGTLEGLGGKDILLGGAGNDTLRGGAEDDVLEGGAGADELDGGANSSGEGAIGDRARFVRSAAGVDVDLTRETQSGGDAQGDKIVFVSDVSTIENLVGSQYGHDTLRGDSRANALDGLGGNDTLDGRGGNDTLDGGDGFDTLHGGDGNDNLYGRQGVDTLYGDNGNDLLYGGEGDDIISGGAGNDGFYGEGGNDTLDGGAGDDTYTFDSNSGADTITDGLGERNKIAFVGVATHKLWITKVGNDLRLAVIGGTSVVTIKNFFTDPEQAPIRDVVALGQPGGSIYLKYARPLIDAMSAISSETTPAALPQSIVDQLAAFWHADGTAAPLVVDQEWETNEDTQFTKSVGAVDHDEDVTSYTVTAGPQHGTLDLNATSGEWTYTPHANWHGLDGFTIKLVDAARHEKTQNIKMTVVSVNDKPSDVILTGAPQSIDERDRPESSVSREAILLGVLSAADADSIEDFDLAVHQFKLNGIEPEDSPFYISGGNLLYLKSSLQMLTDGVAELDFETLQQISLTVVATDRNGVQGGTPAQASEPKTFTFNISDLIDHAYGTVDANTLKGQKSRDWIYGRAGNDTLYGDDPSDVGGGDDEIYGQEGNDTLYGGLGADKLFGGEGADILYGEDGADELSGGDEGDTLEGGAGADTLLGGGGFDILGGGLGNDTLSGDAGADTLYGGDGDDILQGGVDNDTLVGGAGADSFSFGIGDEDKATYADSGAAISIDLVSGTFHGGDAEGDTFHDHADIIVGTAFSDTIKGSNSGEQIEGGDGDDLIEGRDGDDVLFGGLGVDTLIGGEGSDQYVINTTSGADTIEDFDEDGVDVDVLNVDDVVDSSRLWSERVGDDLVISIIETSSSARIVGWFESVTGSSNRKLEFVLAGAEASAYIDGLTTFLAGYLAQNNLQKPTTVAQLTAMRASPEFEFGWQDFWGPNNPPVIVINDSTTPESSAVLEIPIVVTDDVTPVDRIVYALSATHPSVQNPISNWSVTTNASGARVLQLVRAPHIKGPITITLHARDLAGRWGEETFVLNVAAVADGAHITANELVDKTLSGAGEFALGITLSLKDPTESWHSFQIKIPKAYYDDGLRVIGGQHLGDGLYSFTTKEAVEATKLSGPANFYKNLWVDGPNDNRLKITTVTQDVGGVTKEDTFFQKIDINAPPLAATSPAGLSISEGADQTPVLSLTPVGTLVATDMDDNPVTFDIATINGVRQDGGGRFTIINGNQVVIVNQQGVLINYEQNTSFEIKVIATDSLGLKGPVTSLTVNVVDVNEAPHFTLSQFWRSENIPGGEVGQLAASDPDGINSGFHNFYFVAIGGEWGSKFTLDQNTGKIYATGPLDRENTPSNNQRYSLGVRVYDRGSINGVGQGLYDDVTAIVYVDNVDEAPVIDIQPTSTEIQEGQGAGLNGLKLREIRAFDVDSSGLTYTLADSHGGRFGIYYDGGDGKWWVTGIGPFDYETAPAGGYNITVQASAGGKTTDFNTFNVGVTNKAPVLTFLNGGAEYGSPWINFEGQDPNNTPLTFQIESFQVYLDQWITQYNYDNNGDRYTLNQTENHFWFNLSQYSMPLAGYITQTGDFSFTLNPNYQEVDNLFGYIHSTYAEAWDFYVRLSDGYAVSDQLHISANTTGAWVAPIVLDLDGNGVSLISKANSSTDFDMDGYGVKTRTGWVAPQDGILAIDLDGDNLITKGKEISFSRNLEFAVSDLEGLRAYDTNQNGILDGGEDRNNNGVLDAGEDTNANGQLDVGDAQFDDFVVWRDIGSDGVSTPAELSSLRDLGIIGIELGLQLSGNNTDGATDNVIYGTTNVLHQTGPSTTAGDVMLAYTTNKVTITTNHAPDNITLAAGALSAAEDVGNGTVIATLAGNDIDYANDLKFSLVNDAGGRFAVSIDGKLRVVNNALLDYAASPTHQVTVRVTDPGGLTYDKTFTVAVVSSNQAPTDITIASSALTIEENSANGAVLGVFGRVDLDAGDTAAYALTDSADGRFAVNATTGQLTVANGALLNYETATSHQITVQVTDAGGLSFTKTFTIDVTNVNEAPVPQPASLSVAENSGNGTVVGTITSTDPDAGATATFSLTDNAGGRFTIDATTGEVTVANASLLNYEAATSHQISVRVTDAGNLTGDRTYTVNVTNVNEAPVAQPASLIVAENSSNGTAVGTVPSIDPDAGNTATFILTDNAGGRFSINETTGEVAVANGSLLNYDAAPSHQITVRVTDAGGLTGDRTYTVYVTNENEGPDPNPATLSVAENSGNGTVIATISRTDPDSGDTATFSLTNNAGSRFAINATTGQLTVANGALLNYEAATSHQITVRVTDAGGLTGDRIYTVNVTNVNETPADIPQASVSLTLAENSANGTSLGTFGRIDPDVGDTGTFSLTNNAGGRFAVSSAGQLTVANATLLNYEAAASHQITVRVTDAGGLSYDEAFTVNLTNVNEPPTPPTPDRTLSFNENYANGTWLAWFTSTDPEGGITFSLTNNAGGRYAIRSDGLLMAGATNVNYEETTGNWITVRVSDGASNVDQSFYINALNVNEAPTGLTPDRALTFNENIGPGNGLAWFTATDPDGGSFTYSLTNTAGDRYGITSGGCLITGSTNVNYEQTTGNWITVRATDGGGLTYDQNLYISVANVNEAPIDLTADRTLTFNENIGAGNGLAWFAATDPDGGSFTYSLTNNAGGRYGITSGGCLITGSTNVNYEQTTGNWITVRATDSGGLYYDESFYVSVANVNEAPYDIWPDRTLSFDENYGAWTGLAWFGAADVDGAGLSWSMPSDAGGRYAMRSDGLLMTGPTNVNYEETNGNWVLVRATDGGGAPYDEWFYIAAQNVNEAPGIWFAGGGGGYASFGRWDPDGNGTSYQISGVQLRQVSSSYDYWGNNSYSETWNYYGDAFYAMSLSGDTIYFDWQYAYYDYYPYYVGESYFNGWDFYLSVTDGAYTSNWIHISADFGSSWQAPVVLDLDGDGVELTSRFSSSIAFDMTGDGVADRTGWVGADDGMLVLDRNNDGVIASGAEISFKEDADFAVSDLEGLAAYDTNSNGMFDAGDAQYSAFKVWRDANQDGVSQTGELVSLEALGITGIELGLALTGQELETGGDNITYATSRFIRADGTTGEVGDVALAYVDPKITVEAAPDYRPPNEEVPAPAAAPSQARSHDVPVAPAATHDAPSPEPHAVRDEQDQSTRDAFRKQAPAGGVGEESDSAAGAPSEPGSTPEIEPPKREAAIAASEIAFDQIKPGGQGEAWAPDANPATPGALDARLGIVSKQHLQMVQAMASFDPKGATQLALRDRRHVDSAAAALLTTSSDLRMTF